MGNYNGKVEKKLLYVPRGGEYPFLNQSFHHWGMDERISFCFVAHSRSAISRFTIFCRSEFIHCDWTFSPPILNVSPDRSGVTRIFIRKYLWSIRNVAEDIQMFKCWLLEYISSQTLYVNLIIMHLHSNRCRTEHLSVHEWNSKIIQFKNIFIFIYVADFQN